MKTILYIHCGIYKTGSSFLQTMFVRNRDLLRSKGIHYPKSEKELEMFEGKISPGNGVHLSDILTQNEADIIQLLSADLAESKNMGMDTVLYSSERLFHRFLEIGTVNKLQHAAKQAGYDEINALIYFRDPVSHALSTYKHRAKYGDHDNFQRWLQNQYEVFDLIRAFLDYSKNSQIQWTCRKYKSDSVHMVKSSFVDWLKTTVPQIPDDDRVNRSLQLNEIRVLQILKKKYPGTENFIRESFLALQPENKETEKGIKEFYTRCIMEQWNDNISILNSLNLLLSADEKLNIESDYKISECEAFLSLSEKQLQAITDGVFAYVQSEKLINKLNDYLERGINKVRRKWAASKISRTYPK